MDRSVPSFISNAIGHFLLEGPILSVFQNYSGHINDTCVVTTTERKYIVQRLNTAVFTNPRAVMSNVKAVTDFLYGVIKKRGGDATRETLRLVNTVDGRSFYQDVKGNIFRCFLFIPRAVTFTSTDDPAILFEAGRCLGQFEKDLASFPMKSLRETIPDFHATGKRYFTFITAAKKDPFKRLASCIEDVEFFAENRSLASPPKGLPLRVAHYDPKLTNVMFDEKTHQALALIDLDTVMPGYSAFDFGDAIRYDCSSGDEGEVDQKKVTFLFESYKAFLKGYLSVARPFLTAEEFRYLSHGALQMTYECGMRFLTDYLLGDVYFKIDRPLMNLDRARNHEKLLREMLAQKEKMDSLIG